MHARLRPVGGRSGQGFSLYHDKECESQLTIAHAHGPDRALGLCASPRSKGAKPASKQKVVHVRRPGRRPGTLALNGRTTGLGGAYCQGEHGLPRASANSPRCTASQCKAAHTAARAAARAALPVIAPCAPKAEPTTCFKIREVLGMSMCTEKMTDGENRRGRARSDEEISYQLRQVWQEQGRGR